MSVYLKLLNIQSELKAPKDSYNSFGKYSYRSCESILEALKPILNKNKASVIISDDIVFIEGRYYVKATVKFIDAESGESLENSALAREEETKKGMDASQITGSTSSYARKYALNGMFAIDDTKDSDFTNTHDKDDSSKPKDTNKLTESQVKRLYAIGNKAGVKPQDILKVIKHDYEVGRIEDMTKVQYDEICSRLEAKVK